MAGHGYVTQWGVFICIVLAYLGLSLWMGAKKVYFDPYTEAPEDPEGIPTGHAATVAGGDPWQATEQPSTAPVKPEEKPQDKPEASA